MVGYLHKVLQVLRQKPPGQQQFDKIMIQYYIVGLTSQRLRDIAILTYLKTNSHESSQQVIKGIRQFATQLKIKGGKKASRSSNCHNSDSKSGEDSSSDNNSDSNSDSDNDKVYRYSKKYTWRSKKKMSK
ncbi:hypothetical protein L873DRAFT_1872391 [Choiromyces venosus 120613-1]|uniref:Uncharacterized protein n=1 Tax=Choiromyces venosus 120613-1 TaxID=1336337 RepID=A0A3N4IY07_9PEZI|nr:hypothetical protein L873DRAFT_1872391 [Choiromyces venosus 120613-1]